MTRTRTGATLLAVSLLLAACAGPSVDVNPDPPAPMSPPSSAPPVPAGPVLTRLAATLGDAPADTTLGAYQYVERRTWYQQIIGPPGPTGWPERVRVDQLWRTDDGAEGRLVSVHLDAHGCIPDDGGSGSWAGRAGDRFDQPPPRQPDALRVHLLIAGRPEEDRPQDIVGGVAMLYERHAPTRPVRAAVLRLLAQQPGLLAQAGVTDRGQRPGMDLILPYTDRSGVPRRDILTIDAHSGVLLAARGAITGPIPSQDPRLGPDYPALIIAEAANYRLYVDSRRTPDTRTPAAGCQHPALRPGAGQRFAAMSGDSARPVPRPSGGLSPLWRGVDPAALGSSSSERAGDRYRGWLFGRSTCGDRSLTCRAQLLSVTDAALLVILAGKRGDMPLSE
ncbi:hypothetical protein FJK98_31695 [Micromonospora sp. HM134]|uniref:hypothetical protein n=1 Tax=Micromonospora sp. HM134 TaxID=2583243 RepID=UPI0011987EF5|nr:hypothetical protein [Micromonospora sp. HM134]QDY11144.1 hypothetical protein FJK98_31695 [Micromonospora sp. HM134]